MAKDDRMAAIADAAISVIEAQAGGPMLRYKRERIYDVSPAELVAALRVRFNDPLPVPLCRCGCPIHDHDELRGFCCSQCECQAAVQV